MNNKKAELTARKIIVMLLVIIVIAFTVPSNFRLTNLVSSGISSFEEQACLSTINYKLSYDQDISREEQVKIWEEQLEDKDCPTLKKETDKDKTCSCVQEKIWDELNKIFPSEKQIEKQFQIGNSLDETKTNVGVCKPIDGSFDPNNVKGTPYWVTTRGETGQDSLLKNLAQVITDTGGTKSYGNYGLNSEGGAVGFWNEYGENLGLEGTPGTSKADESWKKIATEKADELVLAEISWYNKFIIDPTINKLKEKDFKEEIRNDPRVIAYLSDVTIQEGASLRNSLLLAVEPGLFSNAESYLEDLAEYQSSDEYLKKRFRTYLSEHPENLQGLKNRVLKSRYPLSLQVGIIKIDENTKVICSAD